MRRPAIPAPLAARGALGALAALAVATWAPRPAAATPYETFINVDDEADLEDLLAAGDLSQDTFDELRDLLELGVDLSTADRAQLYALPNLTYEDVDRIIAFRQRQNGRIRDPAALVSAGVITEDKLLAIAAFLVLRSPGAALGVHGWVRAESGFTPRDPLLPPALLRARLSLGRHTQAGLGALFNRLDIGAPVYDPNRGALIADARSYRGALPKLYLKYEGDAVTAIAGSFRAGFAQRLTFDDTPSYTPNGFYADDQLLVDRDLADECHETRGTVKDERSASCDRGTRYVTPDVRARAGLLGIGVGHKQIAAGGGWIAAYGWASVARRSIYQYELMVRSADCPDPHADKEPACKAPPVFIRPDGPLLTPTPQFVVETLPDVFSERLVGGNLTYYADRRNAVGLTAYGATLTSLVEGIDLDTQEWSRWPTGRRYGAAGVSFTLGRGWLDLGGEAALSFDRQPDPMGPQEGGGGPAVILRATATEKRRELEASLRYYSVDYANPYARPISQPDELDGQRARDELGARLRYTGVDRRLSLRALVDFWYSVASLLEDQPQPKLDAYVRADARTTRALQLGLWLQYQDKDLTQGGHAQCFESPVLEDEDDEPIPCVGRQITTTARAGYTVGRRLSLDAWLSHQLLDDGLTASSPFKDRFRQDLSGTLIALWRPDRKLRVHGRLRYLDESFNDGTDKNLERSLTATADVAISPRGRDQLRLRADLKRWLDQRASSLARSPNPSLTLWLSYEARL